MIKDIIRYVMIVLVVIGIVLVMKNLIDNDGKWEYDSIKSDNKDKTQEVSFTANISLVDKETNELIEGANLVVKDETGKTLDSWTTTYEVYKISNLKPGNYVLEQETAAEGYKLSSQSIEFKIDKNNTDVVMRNEAMNEEEKKAEKEKNTSSDEVGVDNTLSTKSGFKGIISIIALAYGLRLLWIKVFKENNVQI